jgi:hypothetical protein
MSGLKVGGVRAGGRHGGACLLLFCGDGGAEGDLRRGCGGSDGGDTGVAGDAA